jgi:hypothetical protein
MCDLCVTCGDVGREVGLTVRRGGDVTDSYYEAVAVCRNSTRGSADGRRNAVKVRVKVRVKVVRVNVQVKVRVK